MGLPYFETSVLTFFGVNEVFENAIRAALCVRRNQRFWMTNLRRVLKPKLQVRMQMAFNLNIKINNYMQCFYIFKEPFCPPKPSMPLPSVMESSYKEDLIKLFEASEGQIFVCVCSMFNAFEHD